MSAIPDGQPTKYADSRYNSGFFPELYNPTAEDREFLKSYMGIQDEKELRDHIIRVTEQAYNVGSSTYLALTISP